MVKTHIAFGATNNDQDRQRVTGYNMPALLCSLNISAMLHFNAIIYYQNNLITALRNTTWWQQWDGKRSPRKVEAPEQFGASGFNRNESGKDWHNNKYYVCIIDKVLYLKTSDYDSKLFNLIPWPTAEKRLGPRYSVTN